MKLPLFLSVLLIAGACSPEDDPPPNPTGDSPAGGDPQAGDGDFRPDTCQIDSFITRVIGSVTDESGNGLENARAQLCVRVSSTDELKCIYPATADSAGGFEINVPQDAQCMRQAVMRAILPGADRSVSYCEIDMPTDRPTVTLTEPFVLYETTPAVAPPAREPADQERTVEFSDGLELGVVPERYFGSGDGYDDLAARRLAADADGLCLDNAPALDALYAFSPEGDITGDPFPVVIPNTDGYAANAIVDLYLLGGLGCTLADTSHVPEGDWVSIGTATVSSDGTVIEGGTVPCLNWLGVVQQ